MQGAVSEDGAYVLGVSGFLTEDEMHETLKVNFPLNYSIKLYHFVTSFMLSGYRRERDTRHHKYLRTNFLVFSNNTSDSLSHLVLDCVYRTFLRHNFSYICRRSCLDDYQALSLTFWNLAVSNFTYF